MNGIEPPAAPAVSRLIGLASVLVDVTVAVPSLPPRGGDVIGRSAGTAPGGGLNALVAASRLGLHAAYAGPHGSGPNGHAVRTALRHDGVALLTPASEDADTGWCLALIEPDGERTFVTVPGAEAVQDGSELARLALEPGDVVYVSGYDLAYPRSGPALARWLDGLTPLSDGGPWLAFDPGPLVAEIPVQSLRIALRRTGLLTVSDRELAALVHRVGPAGAVADRPGELAGSALVLARGGAQGAVLHWLVDGQPAMLAAPAAVPPGPVVDTNGAGDAHLGALLAALHRGQPWPQALAYASRAAAWSLTRPGAATGPTLADL